MQINKSVLSTYKWNTNSNRNSNRNSRVVLIWIWKVMYVFCVCLSIYSKWFICLNVLLFSIMICLYCYVWYWHGSIIFRFYFSVLFSGEHQNCQRLDYKPRFYHGICYDPVTHSLVIAQSDPPAVHVHSPDTLKKTRTISRDELGLSDADYIWALCCGDGKLYLAVGFGCVTSLRAYQVITTSSIHSLIT